MTSEWWGQSPKHGWVVLDRSLESPGQGKLLFFRCSDATSFWVQRDLWQAPAFVYFALCKDAPSDSCRAKWLQHRGEYVAEIQAARMRWFKEYRSHFFLEKPTIELAELEQMLASELMDHVRLEAQFNYEYQLGQTLEFSKREDAIAQAKSLARRFREEVEVRQIADQTVWNPRAASWVPRSEEWPHWEVIVSSRIKAELMRISESHTSLDPHTSADRGHYSRFP